MKKFTFIIIGLVILFFGVILNNNQPSKTPKDISTVLPIVNQEKLEDSSKKILPEKIELEVPNSFNIEGVPFVSQAPFANWDKLHDEACEEASIVIAYNYQQDKKLTPELMEEEVQKLVKWQNENWGGHNDLTSKETITLADEVYGMKNLEIKKILSIQEIKNEISQNHLVITPTAGRLLGNPNFRSPGPIYHMLVVSGYTQNQIITQDVGTRKGEDYKYSETIFFNAIHDWNGNPENIESGPKNIIILKN